MVIRRDERITRLALGSAQSGGRLKSGDQAPQLVELLALDAIDPDPDQPRRHFDEGELEGLADSLRSVGQLQPIVVIRQGERYRIHIGERRWRAAQRAGLTTIRALVRASAPDARTARIAQIVENDQRADLTTRELIDAVQALQADGLKGVEIAAALSRPKSRISELAALADAPDALAAVVDTLGLGLSYQLLRQWRAAPQATLDFLARMPVDHISRVLIATIGTEPGTLTDEGINTSAGPSAKVTDVDQESTPTRRDGEGASPRESSDASAGSQNLRPGARPPVPAPTVASVGSLWVQHAEHGEGQILFGVVVAADHFAVRFEVVGSVILHKDDVRILRTRAARDGD